jgi:PAS domain S-box-containing protein/diguanylate cyclase (GGDEF)-like protein
MATPLKLLILEDRAEDAELAAHEIAKAGFALDWRRVQTEDDFLSALGDAPDLIIADYSLPGYDGLLALRALKARGLDIPFIVVSGTIGEELAVSMIREGATDYLLKDRLARLGQAAARALAEKAVREEKRLADEALKASEQRFRALIENSPDGIAVLDTHGSMLYASPTTERLLGYDEQERARLAPDGLVHPEDLPELRARAAELLETDRGRRRGEFRLRQKDGGWCWLEAVASNLTGETAVGGIVVNFRDVTDRKIQQGKIARLSRMHAVLSGINSAIVRIRDKDQLFREACRIAVVHGRFRAALIALTQEAQELQPAACVTEDETVSEAEVMSCALVPGAPVWQLVVRTLETGMPALCNDTALLAPAGPLGYGAVMVLPIAPGGKMAAVMILCAAEKDFFDDEEHKLLNELAGDIGFALDYIDKEERLNYLAYYDALTGLPNRTLFYERLGQMLQMNPEGRIPLLLLNLDRYAAITDSFGQPAGDQVLKHAARMLNAAVKPPDLLTHLGGGSFAVALSGPKTEAEIAHVAEGWIGMVLAEPLTMNGDELRLLFRAGIAVSPEDGTTPDVLLRNAETALHKARESGDSYVFYAPDMNRRVAQKLSLESRLSRTLEHDQFVLHYQPKVESKSGRLRGLEALIRWDDPEEGIILPGRFIAALEESGLIVDVGRWAMEKARTDYQAWLDKGLNPPKIAVNVSNMQLRRKHFVQEVDQVYRKLALPWLDLEITESMLMEDMEAGIAKLSELQESGIAVSVDDFGTGYSSLSYIGRLPVEALKIDRSFIVNMTRNTSDMAIVTSVITLAHSLNLRIIAEGVDSGEQAKLLKLLQCDEMQGFLFSPPLPPAEIELLLAGSGVLNGTPSVH